MTYTDPAVTPRAHDLLCAVRILEDAWDRAQFDTDGPWGPPTVRALLAHASMHLIMADPAVVRTLLHGLRRAKGFEDHDD